MERTPKRGQLKDGRWFTMTEDGMFVEPSFMTRPPIQVTIQDERPNKPRLPTAKLTSEEIMDKFFVK